MDSVVENGDGAPSVKSAERVFDLLETIGRASDGATFGSLHTELRIPKSSLHALLGVLVNRGYVDLDQGTRRYAIGIRAWETGQTFQRHRRLLSVATPILDGIVARENETAQLATLSGRDNIYLAKVDSTHPLRLQSEVGTRLSAHATGVGKALLAQIDKQDVLARFGRGKLPVITPTTYKTADALLEELELTRQRGFAVDNAEYTPGVFCVAVPVYEAGHERAMVALSVSVPSMRVTTARLAVILQLIAEGSLTISARCGVKSADPLLMRLTDKRNAAKAIAALAASGRYTTLPSG
jgi:IclR family acetate operon transcriptional repressor